METKQKGKNIYKILLAVLIPSLAFANPVSNPSMEGDFIYQDPLGDVAEYWTSWANDYSSNFSENNTYAHDGSKSQEINWLSMGPGNDEFGPSGIYQQMTNLQHGQLYMAAVWFKFKFKGYIGSYGYAGGGIEVGIGVDPNGGTNPDNVTNWNSEKDDCWGYLGDDYYEYEGPWLNCDMFFSPNDTNATIFINANGHGNARFSWGSEPTMPATWSAYCYIDDVNVKPLQISQDSNVVATTPIPANGTSSSEIIITVIDTNSEPVGGIPPSEIDVNCTGGGNLIIGPDDPTNDNGQTTARIISNNMGIKTVSASVFGTELSEKPTVRFCKSDLAKLRASDGASEDAFGCSVDIDGNTALVGAYRDNDNGDWSGSAYIFRYNGSDWVQQAKLLASDGAEDDRFGWSVAIDGNTVIIGAYGDDDNGSTSGSAYIFHYNGSNWVQQDKLYASDGASYDHFGRSVAIDGNNVIVGAAGDDDNGAAYIFRYNGSSWVQEEKLLASDGAYDDCFGRSVAIDANTAIIGAYGDDDNGSTSGSAYIFRCNGSNWLQQAKLLASDGAYDDHFGWSVAIDANATIVGAFSAYGDDDTGHGSGSAYIFRCNGSNWVQQDKLYASDGAEDDRFGWSVAIDANTAIIGAYGDDDNGDWSGSAYISQYNGSNWVQQNKLLASDGAEDDRFGYSVAIDTNNAIVGAYEDDDNGYWSGSAYIFPVLFGDMDHNRDIDLIDFAGFADQWLRYPDSPSADIAPCGGDCVVDLLDLQVFCENWLSGK